MTTELNLADVLEREPELAMLVAQPPIAFHRSFVDVTGSATTALLLSICIEQSESALSPEGWFSASAQDWETRSGLSRKEQATARKNLKDMHLLEERKTSFPATLEVRIKFDRLSSLLLASARKRAQQMRDRFNTVASLGPAHPH
jgi:hypothetical protein